MGDAGKAIAGCTLVSPGNPSTGCSSGFSGNDNNFAQVTGNAKVAFAGGITTLGVPNSYQPGSNDTATSDGEGAVSNALAGNDNTAEATGDNSTAAAFYGDQNTANATGSGSLAIAGYGNNNMATVDGNSSEAYAGYGGDGFTASATGDSLAAVAQFPSPTSVACTTEDHSGSGCYVLP